MPPLRFEDVIEAAWPTLDAAIKTGLADKSNRDVGAVVPLVERSGDLAAHVELSWTSGSTYRERLAVRGLTASVTGVSELTLTERLEDLMNGPNAAGPKGVEAMEALGREARTFEYRWVLSQLVDAAEVVDSLTANGVKEVTKKGPGWRLLAFRQKSEIESELRDVVNVEVLGASYGDDPGPVAVLFPLGRTTVSRLEDFSPSAEREGTALSVSLTARLKLVGLMDPEWPIKRFGRISKRRTGTGTAPPQTSARGST